MVDQAYPELITAAAALVVVAADGSLLAFAEIALPSTVRSSGAAEAWALYVALQHALGVGIFITDCHSLLDTAAGGLARATSAAAPLAAIWRRIGSVVDGAVESLVSAGLLVWMPSHTARSRIGTTRRSDGCLVTPLDWRANRLVDALAKRRAFGDAVSRGVVKELETLTRVAATAAAALGAWTHAANNFVEHRTTPAGGTVRVVRRDVVTAQHQTKSAAKRPWRKRALVPPRPPVALAPPTVLMATPPAPRQDRHAGAVAATAARRARRKAQHTAGAVAADFAVRQVLADRHGEAKPVEVDLYAKRAALLARVRANSGV